MEGAYAISSGNLVSFSEQQLVDCNTVNAGCNGGVMQYAYDYIIEQGIERETDYPYEGADGTCRYDASKTVTRLSSYVNIPQTEAALQDAVGEWIVIAVVGEMDLKMMGR